MTDNRIGAVNEESNITNQGNSDGDKVIMASITQHCVISYKCKLPINLFSCDNLMLLTFFLEKFVVGPLQID